MIRQYSLAALAFLALLAGCKTELFSDLTEHEANEMIAALHRSGIAADRQGLPTEGISVLVDTDAFADAVDLLKGLGLPRPRHATLGDVFKGDGFVVSPVEERARFIFAMTEELSRTISSIDGVISARTHVVLPIANAARRGVSPSSASVFIRHDHDANIDALLPQIKVLVANSVEGLDYDNVSVVLVPVSRSQPEPVAAPAGITGRPRAAADLLLPAVAGAGATAMIFGAALVLTRRGTRKRRLTVAPVETRHG